MKLHFLGANRQVTGSRYCIETDAAKVMIDCGLFQERQYVSRNWDKCPVDAEDVDSLLLTHAHVDHCGLIPKFSNEGFDGPVFCTKPTVELAEIILRDSARIQKEDVAYKKKRHQQEGRKPKKPAKALYTENDVDRVIRQFTGIGYDEPQDVADGIKATFHDAGHILGSAMIEVAATENGQTRIILFSGDVGQHNKPIIRDPTTFKAADYVVMESTYGDRDHPQGGEIDDQLETIIRDTVERGGNIVIPTFAVERAQELVWHLARLSQAGRIPQLPVFLDSPMAIDVTEVFRRYRDYFDQETWAAIDAGHSPLSFPGLVMTRSRDESKAINRVGEPCLIMATSGMCTSGRIKHHIRQNIERDESTILFVGFQAPGTLGRQIQESTDQVRIHGRHYQRKARVAQLYGFSGHADRSGLAAWMGALESPPQKVFLTHGEEEPARAFATEYGDAIGCPIEIPEYQQTVNL